MFILGLVRYVFDTLVHNWLSLSLGIFLAAAVRVYLDPERMRAWLMDKANISIPATVAFGALTPFCACGTMAVVVSMMAAALPWGAVMAFLTSSPLMSPEDFVIVSGILGRNFALALLAASVLIGLGAGYMTHGLECRTRLLRDQFRFSGGCSCSSIDEAQFRPSQTKSVKDLAAAIWHIGALQILPLFALFSGIGYLINRFVPAQAILALFSGRNPFAVPLAAVIGLPLYVTGPGAVPLIKILMEGGATDGAMLAFMITGPGTSAGVIAGLAAIMKRKAITLYVVYILIGGVLAGLLYDAIVTLG